MSSIGAYGFITLQMEIAPKGMGVEDVSRPGIDGHAYAKTGMQSDEVFAVSTADRVNVAAVSSAITGYRAMQGTKVTVISDIGIVTWDVMVLGVRIISAQRVETPVGGSFGGNYILKAQWRLQLP